jgi:hypothetical protein
MDKIFCLFCVDEQGNEHLRGIYEDAELANKDAEIFEADDPYAPYSCYYRVDEFSILKETQHV